MPTKLEQQYINNLKTFTDALGEIVTTLKEKSNNDNLDTLNDFLKTPMDGLKKVVDELKTVTEKGFTNLNNSNLILKDAIESLNNSPAIDLGSIENIQNTIDKLAQTTSNGIDSIKVGNNEIIAKLDSIKQQRESGMFDHIENPKNKNKIVDGIKTVVLIAGGILAMGVAFKIIGNVDFMSVIALSGAMYIMANVFSKIVELKNMKFIEIAKISAILPLMALALTTSAWILKAMPVIGIGQGLSLILVGTSMGLASYFLLKSIKKVNFKEQWSTILGLPIMLPAIAAGITLSAWVLKAMPVIGIGQGISILLIGSTLGVAAFFLLKAIKGVDFTKQWKTILSLPIILPAIALGLTASAWILKMFPIIGVQQGLSILLVGATLGVASFVLLKAFKKIKADDFPTIMTFPIILPIIAIALTTSAWILKAFPIISLGQGLSILLVGGTLGIASWLILSAIKKFDIKKEWSTILLLPLLLPIIATSIMLSSMILQSFQPIRKPLQFLLSSAAIGLSMLLFAPIVSIIGKMKLQDIIKGVAAIPIIAAAIVVAAYIFRELPDNMIYPDFMWSLGVGLSFLVFTPIVMIAGKMPIKDAIQGAIAIPILASTILAAAWIFQALPDTMKSPEIKWTLTTGLSIIAFGGMAIAMGLLLSGPQALAAAIGLVGILAISGTIVGVSHILNAGVYKNFPDIKWALGVGGSLIAFSLASMAALAGGAANMIGKFMSGGKDPLITIAKSMVNVANELGVIDWSTSKYPTKEYAQGVGGLLESFANIFTKISLVQGFSSAIGSLFGGGKTDFITFISNAADAMLYVRDKLTGDWNVGYPTKEYAQGVGGLLESLANVFATISSIEGKNKFLAAFTGGASINFLDFVNTAADAMLQMRNKLSGDWKNVGYPTKSYAEGVGSFLEALANSFASISQVSRKLGQMQGFTEFVASAADAMIIARDKLNQGSWTTENYPKKEYSEGVGAFLLSMAEAYSKINSGGFLKALSGNKQSLIDFAKEASTAMVEVSKILLGGNYSAIIDKKYVDSFSYLMEEMKYIVKKIGGSEINSNFTTYSVGIAGAISKTSLVLNDGKYDNVPDKNYSLDFSDFILTMSKMIRIGDFNADKSIEFVNFTNNITPAVKQWIETLSSGNFEIKDLTNVVTGIGKIGKTVNNFKSLNLSLDDLISFDKSMKIVVNSINTLSDIPDIKDSMVKNMKKIQESMELLSDSINLFFYESPGGLKGLAQAVLGKNKRDMTEFSNFASGLSNIVNALKILSTLTPMPDGIMKGYQNFLSEFSKMPDLTSLNPQIDSISRLANVFATLANSLASVNSNLEGFTNLSKGLFLISIIDDKKFDNVLQSIDKHKGSLQLINQVPAEKANIMATIEGLYNTANKTKSTEEISETTPITTENVAIGQQQFYADVSDIRALLYEFKDILDKPSQAGSFRK